MYSTEYPKYPSNLTHLHKRFVESVGGDDDWQTVTESSRSESGKSKATDGIETCPIGIEKPKNEGN